MSGKVSGGGLEFECATPGPALAKRLARWLQDRPQRPPVNKPVLAPLAGARKRLYTFARRSRPPSWPDWHGFQCCFKALIIRINFVSSKRGDGLTVRLGRVEASALLPSSIG
jgi:hypothetical protein